MKDRAWCIRCVLFIGVVLVGVAVFMYLVDPCFHFHGPVDGLSYRIHDERYQNDGICRHFDYDAIITGTSMTENFKTSELEALFPVKAIKVPFSGGSFREINENLKRAVQYNPDIQMIVRGLDGGCFSQEADKMRSETYPEYLYDNDKLNDIQYLLNGEIYVGDTLYGTFIWTVAGKSTTTFDEYSYWGNGYEYGKDVVLQGYDRPSKCTSVNPALFNLDNIEQNVISLARDNPQIDFYYFFSPHSILWLDSLNQNGELINEFEMQKKATEMMLADCDNIHVFAFFDDYDMITDLDNYKDFTHYSPEINSYILQCMKDGEHQLTRENYEAYYEDVEDFYAGYDYDAIFK